MNSDSNGTPALRWNAMLWHQQVERQIRPSDKPARRVNRRGDPAADRLSDLRNPGVVHIARPVQPCFVHLAPRTIRSHLA
jgi:hypothetical protein